MIKCNVKHCKFERNFTCINLIILKVYKGKNVSLSGCRFKKFDF